MSTKQTTTTPKGSTNTAPANAAGKDTALNLDGIEMESDGLLLQTKRFYFAPEKSLAPDGRPFPIRGILLKSEMMGEDRPFTGLIFRLKAPTYVGTENGLERAEAGDEMIVPATYNLQAYIEVANDEKEALDLWLRHLPKENIKNGKQTIWPVEVKLKGRVPRSEAMGISALLGTSAKAEELPAGGAQA